jgi:adenosylcobinamide-GDP ribazoletransferase
MSAFLHALTFLTRIPVRFTAKADDWQKSAPYYPLVGFVIGVILAALGLISALLMPPLLASVAVTAGWVWVTGGLHLDGLMDTADGIGSSRTRERMIEIMKDSRVGAMGVLASTIQLLLKLCAIFSLITISFPYSLLVLLLAPALGRAGILLSMSFWPYLHGEEKGMAAGLIKGLTPSKRNLSLVLTAVFAVLFAGPWLAIITWIAWFGFSWAFNRSICKKLGGLSGDTYGALVELSETLTLLVGTVYIYHGGTVGWLYVFG